jgi:RNA polymerase sigma-70 factor (ECF subfamily)
VNIESLYRRAREGNKAAEAQLFQYLSDRFQLFVQQRVQNTEDSRDIVQQTLLSIAEKHRQIDFRTSFAGWAHRVLEYKILDYFKAKRARQKHLERLPDGSQYSRTIDLDPTVKQHMLECLRKVAQANGRFARALNLHYQGYDSDEICEKLKLKKAYFYVVLSRARSMLEDCLRSGGIVYDE